MQQKTDDLTSNLQKYEYEAYTYPNKRQAKNDGSFYFC